MPPARFITVVVGVSVAAGLGIRHHTSIARAPTRHQLQWGCQGHEQHDAWLGELIDDCSAIKPGMARRDILKVFRANSAEQFQAAYLVHRRSSFLQLEVEFQPFRSSVYDGEGNLESRPHPDDRVWKVSRPTLSVLDIGQPKEDPGGHNAWLRRVLEECRSLRLGSTREELERTLSHASGISGILFGERYESRSCHYIGMTIDFQPHGGARFDKEGRVANEPHASDIVWEISEPYLAYPAMD